jgi:hypothetical protein
MITITTTSAYSKKESTQEFRSIEDYFDFYDCENSTDVSEVSETAYQTLKALGDITALLYRKGVISDNELKGIIMTTRNPRIASIDITSPVEK